MFAKSNFLTLLISPLTELSIQETVWNFVINNQPIRFTDYSIIEYESHEMKRDVLSSTTGC